MNQRKYEHLLEVYVKLEQAYGEIELTDTVGLISGIIKEKLEEMSSTNYEQDNVYRTAALIRANTELQKSINLDEQSKEMKCMLSSLFISNLEGAKRCLGLMATPDVS